MKELEIIYSYGRPEGIRDENGFLFFFPKVTKYTGQEERYNRECQKQEELALHLLNILKDK